MNFRDYNYYLFIFPVQRLVFYNIGQFYPGNIFKLLHLVAVLNRR